MASLPRKRHSILREIATLPRSKFLDWGDNFNPISDAARKHCPMAPQSHSNLRIAGERIKLIPPVRRRTRHFFEDEHEDDEDDFVEVPRNPTPLRISRLCLMGWRAYNAHACSCFRGTDAQPSNVYSFCIAFSVGGSSGTEQTCGCISNRIATGDAPAGHFQRQRHSGR